MPKVDYKLINHLMRMLAEAAKRGIPGTKSRIFAHQSNTHHQSSRLPQASKSKDHQLQLKPNTFFCFCFRVPEHLLANAY
jgi:hypothetical protein